MPTGHKMGKEPKAFFFIFLCALAPWRLYVADLDFYFERGICWARRYRSFATTIKQLPCVGCGKAQRAQQLQNSATDSIVYP